VAEHDKREALRRLIRTQNVQNALIFCNRKTEVDILYKSLVRHKFSAGALHGDMAQTVRFTTLEKFKAGELRLLVCSDVAARGLDIGGLSHVFNFDVPHHAEDYVHRIGRTGRAGLEGHAFTIAMPEDRLAVEAIEKLTGHPIPPMIVEGLDPVDWAEFDGRKRRGRKGAPIKKAAPAKTVRGKRSGRDRAADTAREPRSDPSSVTVAEVSEVSGVARDAALPDAAMVVADSQPDVQPRAQSHERAQGRDAAPRMRSPRGEPRRDDTNRGAPPTREERPTDHRRERWRQDDLGPAVVGFGDDIPAFMMVRRMAPVPETDA
jgi:superfamily II DNA/RNA helicase